VRPVGDSFPFLWSIVPMPSWPQRVCETNGVGIHYVRTGGDRPPLVALHGLTGSGACWVPLAHALEDECDLVTPDARGHGRSSAPPDGYRYRDHAGDVAGLIESLGLASPILLGHSMGGMTAALVAARAGVTVRGVVLADPTFLSPERRREVHESDVVEQHRRFLRSDRDELLSQARARHPRRAPELVALMTDARLQTRIQAFDVLEPPSPDYCELVSAIRVPILLVIGDRGIVFLETAQELRSLNRRLRYEQIPDAGHGLPYDQPDRFAVAVRSFVRALAS
jgi:N-formylmaleamate deformylase